MTSKLNCRYLALIALIFLAGAGFGWNVLAQSKEKSSSAAAAANGSSTELSGQELWTMNCQRCHNIRPPTMYSGAQWDVIVHHMRVRANVTGAEQRAIVEFLKSANH